MPLNKYQSQPELQVITKKLKKEGKKIAFANGGFDLLHIGHVDYLEKSKALCDVLVVGVNSDTSIKRYKGEGRPFMREHERMKMVAALESVDYVFVFHERRNKRNIEILKPDYYIKAGDYKPQELTSREVVEKYGGKVQLIPVIEKISTSDLIEKIKRLSVGSNERFIEKENTVHIRRDKSKRSPAIFLDRDGTINEDIGYLHDPNNFKLLSNVLEGLRKLNDMGYLLIIITNQPGIGIGYYSEEDFYRVNRAMLSSFSKAGILIDKIYFCPHSKSEGCSCRKPKQALIERAKRELNLNHSHSYLIGDKTSDMETGKRAGLRTILVRTGFKGEDGEFPGEPDYWAEDLLDAANVILEAERSL